MQNVVGLTVVAMATKFGLGAEIQSPTGLPIRMTVKRGEDILNHSLAVMI